VLNSKLPSLGSSTRASAIRSDELVDNTLKGRVPSSLRRGCVSAEEESAQEKVERDAGESKMDA